MSERSEAVLTAKDSAAIARMFNQYRKVGMERGYTCVVACNGPCKDSPYVNAPGDWAVTPNIVAEMTRDTENSLMMSFTKPNEPPISLNFDSASPDKVNIMDSNGMSAKGIDYIRERYSAPAYVPFYADTKQQTQKAAPQQSTQQQSEHKKEQEVPKQESAKTEPAKQESKKSQPKMLVGVSEKAVHQKFNGKNEPYRNVGFAYPKALSPDKPHLAYFNIKESVFLEANKPEDVAKRNGHTLHIPLNNRTYNIAYYDANNKWTRETITAQEVYDAYEANRQSYKQNNGVQAPQSQSVQETVEQPVSETVQDYGMDDDFEIMDANGKPVTYDNVPQSEPVTSEPVTSEPVQSEVKEQESQAESQQSAPAPEYQSRKFDYTEAPVSNNNTSSRELPAVAEVMEQQEAQADDEMSDEDLALFS